MSDDVGARIAEHVKAICTSEDIFPPGHPAHARDLTGEVASTYTEMEAAARELHAVDLKMRAAQERYRKALAAHMAAITGAKVEP